MVQLIEGIFIILVGLAIGLLAAAAISTSHHTALVVIALIAFSAVEGALMTDYSRRVW